MGDNPFLKDTNEGASATDAGRNSKLGWCGGGGGELNLYESVHVDICQNFFEWDCLVLPVEEAR